MDFLKILWRGMRDTYDSFMYFILVSLAFWVCCSPMLLGFGFLGFGIIGVPIFVLSAALVPPALVVLFALTDPRTVVNRIPWGDAARMLLTTFVQAWQIALITIVPLVILFWNISFFLGSGHFLEVLVPLWILMFVFFFVYTLYAYCLAGTHESRWRNAFRGSMFVLVKYPFRAIGLSLFVLILGYMGWIALLPMIVVGPPFFAGIVNRFVFDALDVYVLDPESPTDERAFEHERGINPDRSVVDRVLRRRKN